MIINKTHDVFKKGQTGALDDIYHLQGVIPNNCWAWVDDDPDSDAYLMLKTVTLDIKVKIVD